MNDGVSACEVDSVWCNKVAHSHAHCVYTFSVVAASSSCVFLLVGMMTRLRQTTKFKVALSCISYWPSEVAAAE